MGILENLFGSRKTTNTQQSSQNVRASQAEVMAKCMAAVRAYQEHDFKQAARFFAEYFEMKGYGRFPQLDMDDYRMYINLMLSQFYSQDYNSCLKTCEKISKLEPRKGDSYAFRALCLLKLGNASEADHYWEKSKTYGCDLSSHFDNIRDVKMQGFNN